MASLRQRARRWAPRLPAPAYFAGAIVLGVAGIRLWRTYCENFGCIGIGIAWFAWSIGYVVLLALGVLALFVLRDRPKRLLCLVFSIQLVAGLLLAGYWATDTLF